MLPGDYLAMKLSGTVNTTISGLSEGMMWDFKEKAPAKFLFDYYGFDEKLVADIVPTFSIQSTVSKQAAEELGLQEGTPISYRGGDQPNNALSLNVFNPGEIASTYAQISEDGKQVVSYAYKTGKQTGVLFDLANTKKIQLDDFDDYILSPDGKKMLIQTQTKRIYRHSFTAVYYIYNIETRLLEV